MFARNLEFRVAHTAVRLRVDHDRHGNGTIVGSEDTIATAGFVLLPVLFLTETAAVGSAVAAGTGHCDLVRSGGTAWVGALLRHDFDAGAFAGGLVVLPVLLLTGAAAV